MSSSLRDDLASLKIERRSPAYRPVEGQAPRPRLGLGRLVMPLLWLVPLAILGGAGVVAYREYDQIRPKTQVSVGVVQAMTQGEAETLLSAKGYVKSVYQASIGAKVPGRVKEIRFKEGEKVHGPKLDEAGRIVEPGQVLAVLEHEDLLAQLESRKAMLERTRADLAEAEADRAFKETRYRRRAELQNRGTVTGEELEQTLTDWRSAESKVQGIRAGIKMQQASLDEIQIQIQDMYVRAPHSGTVTEKGAEVGETILLGGMGAASGRGSVATLADLENLEVDTDIAENLLSRVRPADPKSGYAGQPAEITVSAVVDRRYKGRLVRIIPMGDRSRGTVKVRVRIEDADDRLFPELAATVHFLPDKNAGNPGAGKSFLFVPKAAIFEEAGHSYVWVLDAKSALEKRPVEVVVSGDDLARVDKGLESGERVVLDPAKAMRPGQLVEVSE